MKTDRYMNLFTYPNFLEVHSRFLNSKNVGNGKIHIINFRLEKKFTAFIK